MKIRNLLAAGIAAAVLAACGGGEPAATGETASSEESTEITVSDAELAGNPFREKWDTPFGVPPFDSIEDGHFMPAFKKGILEMRAEIAAIASNPKRGRSTLLSTFMTVPPRPTGSGSQLF